MDPRFASAAAVLAIAVCSWSAGPSPAGPSPSSLAAGHRIDTFTTSEQCGVCHTTAPGATAMLDANGDDVSPYGTWQATMMANSFRDPYFRAQLMKETAAAGEQVQELCLRCHVPMVHHEARLKGDKAPRLADAEGDLFADDGVSCTVCHLMDGKNFGELGSFSGQPSFGRDRRIFGPFQNPATRPMQNFVRYTPTHGPHVQQAGLCGTCHTLFTEHHGTPFPEQTPYLEWRNSEFSDEREGADPATTRTCQQCHMARSAPTRIARNPQGFDFNIPAREGYALHTFVGGNAFMLELLNEHREDLDVLAEPAQFARTIAATRKQLAEATARVAIGKVARAGQVAAFEVQVENLTGHKFPTGYPARRAWLAVEIEVGGEVVFACGQMDERGRLVGVADEQRLVHRDLVEKPGDVVVYEMVAHDPEGAPTTYLTKMVKRAKDNRLLPRGWRHDGPHIGDTAPVGVDGDADFTGGGDKVAFRVQLPAAATGPCTVRATLCYQTVPPAWVDALRPVEAEEAKRFVGYYDAAKKAPEVVARAERKQD
ncbi:MAG: multiheme c-type cytochrome [Planctomycetota bacterium]